MGVCSIWLLMVLCLLSTLKIVTASVNTCRYPNVKITTQSSNHSDNYPSRKAVDGCTKQTFDEPYCCSHTAPGLQQAWWQVDLEGPIVMEYVRIYYRNETEEQKKRFGGYQIYQSNTSDWRVGHRCRIDRTSTSKELSFTQKIRCPGIAQFLTIYSDRRSPDRSWYSKKAILELCEVEVYGCPLGKYGKGTCESDCAAGCANSLCDPVTGECKYCADGYYKDGSLCIECPSNCNDDVCDVESGVCSACTPGYYGRHCYQTCLFNCKDNRCIQSNGKCKDCENEFFGSSCDECSSGCTDRVCDKISGNCSPCKPGYFGDTCNTSCPSNCKGDICNQNSGLCTACKPGYFGDTCNTSCPSNCKGDICNQTSGLCTACEPGFFGHNCNMSCFGHCNNDECQQNNGTCIACMNGYFGLDCEEECGQCSDVSCSRSDGLCLCSNMTHGTCGCKNGWGGTHCTTKNEISISDDQTETHAGVGVGIAVGVVIAIGLVIAIVVIRRRKRLPKHKDNQRESSSSSNSSKTMGNVESLPIPLGTPNQQRNNGDTRSEDRQVYVNVHNIDPKTDNDVVYNNIDVTGVPIHELRSIIDSKLENKASAFQVEFQTFPWGAERPHEAGKKTSNKPKNRFKTTFPYDHSRIVLDTNGKDIDTSYINANYIDGFENEKEYIASQGPKPNTLDDFWRMVWQVNSGKIVMLTNLVEGRNVKCHKYWPDEGESLVTQTFELKLDRERTYAFYVIRDISITLKKTKEERQVHQFHFTTWPDHGTPDTYELVLFDRRVTSYNTPLTGQMIVHCSAGIGRTGTYIGLDALLSHGKKTGKVDIPRYIRTMRTGRMNMIQTYEQYIALHELLVEGFNLQESLIFRVNFPAVLETMCPTNAPANQTRTHREFKVLKTLTPNYSLSCFKAALLAENMEKNRDKAILAADKYRPFLQSQLPNMTDYINAVMIQSHTSMSGYLMTQFPLVDTIDDFWTMVFDYSCENIVVLGKPPEKEAWLREEGGGFAAGNSISVKKLQDRSPNTELAIVDYQVEREISGSETIRIFSMSKWSSNSLLPPSDSSLLQLLEQLDSRRRSDNTRPVVVMCRDGCTQSGLFCCISNIRDQMKMDEEVDIFQITRQLKKRRPEALENVEQYQYCYNILGLYLDSTDVYVN
ncbi:receptor-type tyrosine-protein phosphatase kappa-like [Mizuhopecten yessoensis]|uniref:protein-tyrosine-phosphatase n=1 Tax=Mizuhopecten yessoensis TaxID=6573 RepID=A0A210QC63_MIZYE|nr:receptor-type tyrosine-protein phosphatase kappa-like [Mizuhopecten yessoensis]OWF46319.1 Receptor-type tyrosine-protein phosphatase T [Mizuhopecten yessoensis]